MKHLNTKEIISDINQFYTDVVFKTDSPTMKTVEMLQAKIDTLEIAPEQKAGLYADFIKDMSKGLATQVIQTVSQIHVKDAELEETMRLNDQNIKESDKKLRMQQEELDSKKALNDQQIQESKTNQDVNTAKKKQFDLYGKKEAMTNVGQTIGMMLTAEVSPPTGMVSMHRKLVEDVCEYDVNTFSDYSSIDA